MTPLVHDPDFTLHVGDVRDVLPTLEAGSMDCVVTSPPYWGLRDYNVDGQLGLEATPDEYVTSLVGVFREVRRVLADHGTVWLNLGDSYNSSAQFNHDKPGSIGERVGRYSEAEPCQACRGTGIRDADERRCISCKGKGVLGWPGHRRLIADLKPKDLVGIPWRVAFALQADGWYLRSDIVWSKPNPMPESVTDRPTKSHEYVFLLSKQPRYFFDQEAVREPNQLADGNGWNQSRRVLGAIHGDGQHAQGERGTHGLTDLVSGRNVRSVWEIATQPYAEAHFATFPEKLVERCLLAGCPPSGTVLDPFLGSGTTALVARKHGRRCVGVELNPEYAEMAAKRLQQLSLLATP